MVISRDEHERQEVDMMQPVAGRAAPSSVELQTHTVANLYNATPTRLAHAALDRAVWDAKEVPAEAGETVTLSRLLAPNGERAAGT